MRKVYSQFKPRHAKGEVFTLPSMTDQLADEPIERLVQRFAISGGKLDFGHADIPNIDNMTVDDVDKVFDDITTDDLKKMQSVDMISLSTAMKEHAISELQKSKSIKNTQNDVKSEVLANTVVSSADSPNNPKLD